MNSAAAQCVPGSSFTTTQNTVAFAGVGFVLLVLWVAANYPVNDKRYMRVLGAGGILLAGALSIGAWIAALVESKPDVCGSRHGAAAAVVPWLVIGAGAAIMVGIGMRTVAEWTPVAVLTVVDAMFCVLDLLGHYTDRREIAVLFATHGLCSATAAWWSWRCRGASSRIRAKAAETGRILAGGWLIYALLYFASADEPSSDRALTNSTVGALFVVTAITAIMGTGYTKYVEAHNEANAADRVLPRVGGRPGALRDAGVRAVRAAAGWAGRYRESF